MKILVRDENGIRELEEGYASEVELQQFLKEHAALMPLEAVDLNAPPLLCIGWEVGVLSGAEDILYIDRSGLLTVVETKLRKNPESRREVVGQILEYAAQMSTWTSLDVERQAEAFFRSKHSTERHQGLSLRQAMESHVAATEDDFDYQDFLDAVQNHINEGRFRLVVAIDEAPAPLLKTVEFVNRFSEHFEMYLAQLKRFTDSTSGADIFVPAIFGRVASTGSKSRPPGELWTRDRFFERLAQSDPKTVPYVTKIYELFEEWTDEVRFGSAKDPRFSLIVLRGGDTIRLATISTTGEFWLFLSRMSNVAGPIAKVLKNDLEMIEGIPEIDITRRDTVIPVEVLTDLERLDAVLVSLKRAADDLRSQ